MSHWSPKKAPRPGVDNNPKLINKNFLGFLFSFVAVVAGVLVVILIIGASGV